MAELVAFGEVMLRFSPPQPRRLEQCSSLEVFLGGSELNTTIAAQRLGLTTSYISCLPRNVLGKIVENRCREQGVDTSRFTWRDSGRLGLYFFEYGAPPRPAEVIYDRAGSAFTTLQPGELPWAEILAGSKVFLTSGINPPLAPQLTAVVKEAMQAAKAAGCEVAFDLNYRSKLWSVEEAAKTLQPLLEDVDILFTTDSDTANLLGIRGEYPAAVAREVSERFDIRTVNYIYSPPPGADHLWEVVAVSGGQTVYARQHHRVQTVDRLGAGDAFAAGFLYGHLRRNLEAGVELGNALLALKNTVLGDFALVSLEEVESLARGQGGMIRR
jgi:2-dehydro-3-deoxygluconokinase